MHSDAQALIHQLLLYDTVTARVLLSDETCDVMSSGVPLNGRNKTSLKNVMFDSQVSLVN